MESTFGLIRENLKETGNLIKCREKECLLGVMEENMKAIILMIKSKVMEFSLGQMEGSILVAGTMANNMDLVSIYLQKESSNTENGKKGRDLDG